MAVLPILHWPDPRLSAPCAPAVAGPDLERLAADMIDTMYAAPGRGLAAPQVGALVRIFVMDTGWKDGGTRAPRVFVNPRLLWRSADEATGPEGCLSIPGIVTMVARARTIRLGWQDLDGSAQEAELTGFDAICAQHEYDHLDGVVTLDRLDSEARARAEAEYAA